MKCWRLCSGLGSTERGWGCYMRALRRLGGTVGHYSLGALMDPQLSGGLGEGRPQASGSEPMVQVIAYGPLLSRADKPYQHILLLVIFQINKLLLHKQSLSQMCKCFTWQITGGSVSAFNAKSSFHWINEPYLDEYQAPFYQTTFLQT